MRIIQDSQAARDFLRRRSRGLEVVNLPPPVADRICQAFGSELSAQEVVQRILAEVREGGDAALFRFARVLDGVTLETLEVPQGAWTAAREKVDPDVVRSLEQAAERVRSYHLRQLEVGPHDFDMDGIGQVVRPLERVGLYIPGGAASYPSTVLMTAIPARVAGVQEVVICTPPRAGGVPPVVLLAAELSGVDRLFQVGGAAAIAALAWGTEAVPRVDKVCGPGNIFVQLAKKAVFGQVGVDGIQGPTETLVLADASADPVLCASDLLAQAEHDPLASPILITTSLELAQATVREVDRQLATLERRDIAGQAVASQGAAIVVEDMGQAVEMANAYAPEHLCLLVQDARPLRARLRHAGGIFLGETSPEALGDYVAGPSHVMPTGGTARYASPLTVYDFLKVTSVVAADGATLRANGPSAARLARAEGLTAHARALEVRLERLFP
ncbi:MAG: histidinol dehydrogenase [Chloroflexi bacterium]|nr:histidinol dehydrogenase [Chloroflexota bacterium]